MKTDFYTKTILTVIAVSLVALVIQNTNLVGTVQANSFPTPAKGTSDSVMDVNIVSVDGWNIYGGKLKVEVENEPTVNIKNEYRDLDVNVTNYSDFK
ncbi:MAG: hypothetical protein IMY73_00200 [Bacteroidetes bacterium]|nr:hypothetical protein [Bacteroidota bacterium]